MTLLGQEVINPTGNALYSHSYLFGDAIPFTQTGVLVSYTLTDAITVEGGVTRGWNQRSGTTTAPPISSAKFAWQVDKATKPTLNVSLALRPPTTTATTGPSLT